MARARLDRSAGVHIPKANRHIAATGAENVPVRTEADVQNRLRVSRNGVRAARNGVHAIDGERLVLDDRHRFAAFSLHFTVTRGERPVLAASRRRLLQFHYL